MTPGSAFDALLEKLRGEGFAIGVDRVLMIERLFQGSGNSVSPRRLKYLLGPLLASTAEQQERFEVIYDQFLGLSESARQEPGPDVSPDQRGFDRKLDIGFAALTTAVLALMAVGVRLPEVEPPPMPTAPKAYERPVALPRAISSIAGAQVKLSSEGSTSFERMPLSSRWTLSSRPTGSRARLDPANSFVADVPGDYTVTLTVHDGASASQPTELAIPVPREPPLPPPPAPRIDIRWDRRVNDWIVDFRKVWWLLPPVAVALALLFRRYWERRKILDRARTSDFQHRHTIHPLTLAEDPGAVAGMRTAIQALRRPFEGLTKLDVSKSVVATVKAGLYPTEVRTATRRRAEYLILIDTLSSRDHQSTLFQRVVGEMHRAGLGVDAYLYAGDPRVCRPMPGVTRGTSNVFLADLVHKAAGARLLLFGDGGRLLYEQSAELQPWTEMFLQWQERAIITPKLAGGEWSIAEEALAKRFLVLPATVESFKHFLDHRQADSSFEFVEPGWQYATADELRSALGNNVYRWLSACALYPRLEWVLTQRLGRALKVYSEEGLLRLIRLPWFRRGEMPVELQEELVARMPREEREQARAAMKGLLKEAKSKDEGTPGAEFEIAVQQLDLTPRERQQLKRDMAVARDAAKSDKNWLLSLPRRLKSLLFADSTSLAARSRPLAYLVGVLVMLAGVGALGEQGYVEIAQRYVGPTLPQPAPPVAGHSVDSIEPVVVASSEPSPANGGGAVKTGKPFTTPSFIAPAPVPLSDPGLVIANSATVPTVGNPSILAPPPIAPPKPPATEQVSTAADPASGAQQLNITLSAAEGQGAARDPIIQVNDSNHKPVAGATVTFTLPSQGPSGTFPGNRRTLTVITNQQGRATASGLRANPKAGAFEVAVDARNEGLFATARMVQSGGTYVLVTQPSKVNPLDGLEYAWIPPGRSMMGCSPGDNECLDDEKPTHPVEITQGFWMGRTEVTQAAYQKVTGKNPSSFKGDKRPVENMEWADAEGYCKKVGMRLPTEAEWEYAARAGNLAARYGPVDEIAWYGKDSKVGTQGVGLLRPNAWGLYDMLGNVWEWVSDWYGPYSAGLAVDPRGPPRSSRSLHALRGWGWCCEVKDSLYVRASDRSYDVGDGYLGNGFRCAGEIR